MSLHVDTTGFKDRAWHGSCRCGWTSETTHDGHPPNAARAAREDYRMHVEQAMGVDAYYTAPVACRNCGSEHEQGVLLGTYVCSADCIRCGMNMLSPRNDAWNETQRKPGRISE